MSSGRVLKAIVALGAATNVQVLATNVGTVAALIADDTALYWYGDSAGLWSVTLGGGTPTNLAASADPTGFVRQGQYLYWLDFTNSDLERVSTMGGTPERLVEIFYGGSMAANDSGVYWSDRSNATINAWPIGAHQSIQLAKASPYTLYVDGGFIYFADSADCGHVWKLATDGSSKQLLLEGLTRPDLVAIDATHLFVNAASKLYRLDR